jgi:hypothetical protein
MVARANRSGKFRGPLRWRTEGSGAELAVTCYADLVGDDDGRVEVMLDMKTAKAEGWDRNPKYATIPEQMLKWRTATWLVRLYCPEMMMGLSTADELEDTRRAGDWAEPRDVTPRSPAIEHREESEEQEQEPPKRRGRPPKQRAEPPPPPSDPITEPEHEKPKDQPEVGRVEFC